MLKSFAAIGALLALAACEQPAGPPAPAVSETAGVRGDLPLITVYKTATCGCCKAWVNHLREAGFPVDARDVENLGPIKERVGVPHGMGLAIPQKSAATLSKATFPLKIFSGY